MEKNMAFASGSTQPSAPPPSAPPSYEEAVENAARVSRQPNIPVGIPYPVGPSSMPMSSSMPRTYYLIFIFNFYIIIFINQYKFLVIHN